MLARAKNILTEQQIFFIYNKLYRGIDVIMNDRLFLNKEVSVIVGLTQRQILSWTERGLIEPEKPAKKAGSRRGYNYINLLEFGLAKYLLDVIGLQSYTTKQILAQLREDGDIAVWASNYSSYCISFNRRIENEKKEDLSSLHMAFRVNDPDGLGGTMDFNSDVKRVKDKKSKVYSGTLYYIFTNYGKEKLYKETIRIVSPWDIGFTHKAFDYEELKDIITSRGMIIVNLGQIKEEIDKGLKKV